MIKHEHILRVFTRKPSLQQIRSYALLGVITATFQIPEILRPQRARDNKRGTKIIPAVKKRETVLRSSPKEEAINVF